MAFAVHQAPTSNGSSRSIHSSSNNNNNHSSQNWGHTVIGQSVMTASAVDEATVDTYAKTVLEAASPSDNGVDVDADYLGSYITGVIRAEKPLIGFQQQDDEWTLKELPDYDSLLELLQEHCSMARSDAKATLKKIAQAVMTGTVPIEFVYSSSVGGSGADAVVAGSPHLGPFGSPPSSHGLSCSSLSALQLLQTVNVEAAAQESTAAPLIMSDFRLGASAFSSSTATPGAESVATSVLSPFQANNLIPVDLLGIIDYEEDNTGEDNNNNATAVGAGAKLLFPSDQYSNHHQHGNNNNNDITVATSTASQTSSLAEEFPSLSVSLSSKLTKRASRSSRSRQGSIDESSIYSEHSSSLQPQEVGIPTPPQPPHQQLHELQQQRNQYYYDQESGGGGSSSSEPASSMLQMAFDMLIHMNPDMGQDAIFQAATMAPQSDVGVAQYLMECAMTAPPVCRHLLQSGCYRSDCTFSHDLEGHTCVFWLRGRCGKGTSACQFLHGYNDKWLRQLEEQQQQQQAEMEQNYQQQQQQQQQQQEHSYGEGPREQSTTSAANDGDSSETPLAPSTNSFANIATKGYSQTCYQKSTSRSRSSSLADSSGSGSATIHEESKFNAGVVPTMKIPQDVWNPHERRDSSAFHIADPMERYREVSRHQPHNGGGTHGRHGHSSSGSSSHSQGRTDVIDLHFQSTKTFAAVLAVVIPEKMVLEGQGVWIVTGTGHHVGTKTHQKGGGILESAVMSWLTEEGYDFWKGKDRNGHGGAIYVKKSGSFGIT